MYRIFLMSVLWSTLSSAAGFADGTYVIHSARIVYAASHPLHAFESTSHEIKGKALCANKTCELLVGVPVKSFDSENSNRDAHMIEITKGLQFPLVTFRAKFSTGASPSDVSGEVEFSGHKHEIKLTSLQWSGNEAQPKISGQGNFGLKDFGIEVPTLLGVPMSNEIKITIEAEFKKM